MHDPGPWVPGRTVDSIITLSVPCPDDGTKEYYGGEVICESVRAHNKPVIMAAPNLLTCLKWAMGWVAVWANDIPRENWDAGFADSFRFAIRTIEEAEK